MTNLSDNSSELSKLSSSGRFIDLLELGNIKELLLPNLIRKKEGIALYASNPSALNPNQIVKNYSWGIDCFSCNDTGVIYNNYPCQQCHPESWVYSDDERFYD